MSKVHPGFEERGRIPAHDVHCMARQSSDQMVCDRCARTQDVNELSPRSCPLTGRDMRTGGGPSPILQLIGDDVLPLWDNKALLDFMSKHGLGREGTGGFAKRIAILQGPQIARLHAGEYVIPNRCRK